ncbi:MAG: NADH-quinone oxidoreductase subunit NuoN [Geminicoccaceae bacterium]
MPLDLAPAVVEVFLFLAAMVLLLIGALRNDDRDHLLTPLTVLVLLVGAVIALAHEKSRTLGFEGHFVFDGFAALMKALILVGAAGSLLLAGGYNRDQHIERFEFPLLALFSALGMCMMVSANSFIALYMALELQSLPLYVLAALNRDNQRSTEAGLKYFVLGALASGLLLYGCSLVYGFTGTLSFDVLATTFGSEGQALASGAIVGLVFIVAGLAFKLAAVPFHMWTPDVYEGAPTPVTAFIAGAPKLAAMGLTLRVLMEPFGHWADQWGQVVVVISIASMGLGAFAAIGQSNIKRLMAYSGIANIGFALVGAAAGSVAGVNGAMVYMAIYLITTVGTFACILQMRRDGVYVERIDDLAGLSQTRPGMALMLAIFMFSLAGIPPLAGFVSKLYVFKAAIDAGLVSLAVIGVVLSVVGAYYYLRIVKIMYFDTPAPAFDASRDPALGSVAAVCAILVMFFLVPYFSSPLLNSAQAAAQALAP